MSNNRDDKKPAAPPRRRLLSVKEYADQAGQHPQTIYKKVRNGRQGGVHRCGDCGAIRLEPLEDDDDE